MPRNVCFYHRSDLDGHCGGAIYAKYMTEQGLLFKLHGIDYGDEIPWDLIDGEDLTIIDWSFQPWSLFCEVLRRANSVMWIDHHKSAIEEYQRSEVDSQCRLLTLLDTTKSGCELAWQRFFPNNPMPEAVRLLGRYDVWDHQDRRVLPFQYRMRLEETDPKEHARTVWFPLLRERVFLDPYIIEGNLFLRYQEKQDASEVTHTWFPLHWNNMLWVACNRTGKGSTFFKAVWEKEREHFDGMMTFGWTGKRWRIGLYSDKEDVDCSAIAKANGGGGHKGAAGFQCDVLPFDLNCEVEVG